jgi:hypothetical protein
MKKYILNASFSLMACTTNGQSGIYISNGGTLHADGNATISIENGAFINDGTFNANGSTLTFSGNASNANSSIGGATQTVFNNIVVNKIGNNVQVNQNIKVNGNFTFTQGGVELKAGDIDFGTTGSLQNETESNKAFGTGGKLMATATLNTPTSANPANLGAIITSTQNLGITTVKRGHNIFAALPLSIQRNYDISPANNAALNATLRLRYFDNELNGNVESTMLMARSANNGVNFTPKAISLRNVTDNFAEATGVSAFSIWTLGPASVLPIDLLYFKGFAKNDANVLNWATARESNNVGFEIERSDNKLNFYLIGFVKTTADNKGQQAYDFTDNAPLIGLNYYRLKQLDTDGKSAYSPVIALEYIKNISIAIYPNPATHTLNLVTNEEKTLPFSVANSLGQVVLRGLVKTAIEVDIQSLGAGLYTLVCDSQTVRFVKH